MNKQRIYIMGPMRGYENYNFDAFDNAKAYLEELGFEAVSPADLDRQYEGWDKYPPKDFILTEEKKREMIVRDIQEIVTCQCIYGLQGWENSKGSAVEYALGLFLDLEIMFEQEKI